MRSLNLCVVIAATLSLVDIARGATTYVYDDLGRLKQAKYDNGKQIDYNYDQAGNRTSVATSTSTPHGAMLKPAAARHKILRKKH